MNGIVYIAVGNKYLEMSIDSALSVESVSKYKLPIIIFTDAGIKRNIGQNISISKIPKKYTIEFAKIANDFNPAYQGQYLKTRLFDLSPFKKTLYLDSDILAIKDFSDIWDYSDKGLGLAPAFSPLRKDSDSLEAIDTLNLLNSTKNNKQYNAGVVLFEKSLIIKNFFKTWNNQWEIFKECDQMALTRALCISNPPILILPAKYNEFYPWANNNTLLIHYVIHYKKYLDNAQSIYRSIINIR